jgi:surface-anchored protein/MYXO-CTERM domain-containing protein
MRIRWLACLLALLGGASAAPAQVFLSNTHIDFGMGYGPSGWDLHIKDDIANIEYSTSGAPGGTDWAIARLLGESQAPRPAGTQFDFIGVQAGQNIFRVTDVPSPQGLLMGIGAEENTPGTFASYFESDPRVNATGEWIRVRLKAFTGPGHVSLWGTDLGGPVVYWATADGLNALDTFFVLNGTHADLNWAFTEPGEYTLTLEASAFLGPGATNPTFSGDTVYTVQAVPEPSSLALAGLVGLAGVRAWRRRGSAC